MKLIISIVTAALMATVGALLLAVIAARRLVLPGRRATLTVIDYEGGAITLPSNRDTLHPGQFGIWAKSDHTHTRVGEVLDRDTHAGTVRRRIVGPVARALEPGEIVNWTSHVFADPAALSAASESVNFAVNGGAAPAWMIPASAETTRWAIHIHGIRTTRVTALRSVPAAREAGMVSLVVSFRNDGEAPTSANGASMLGSTEWRDLEPALRYAQARGATSITLIAWSMGAQVALNYLRRGNLRHLIRNMVLIAPVTDWKTALANALHRAHLPAFLSHIALRILAVRPLNKVAGTAAPIDARALDWTETELAVPTLIVHSRDDREAPIGASRRLARANPDTVTLVERSGVDHALEYNADPDWFTQQVSTWLDTH